MDRHGVGTPLEPVGEGPRWGFELVLRGWGSGRYSRYTNKQEDDIGTVITRWTR